MTIFQNYVKRLVEKFMHVKSSIVYDSFKKTFLMNAFFKSEFSYCSLVWMYHSRANNGKINRLHERCLQIMYSDKQSSFETLFEKNDYVSVHNQNLQILATEMYKIKNCLSTLIVTELFKQRTEQH